MGLDADGIYTRVKESIDVLDDRRAKPQKVGDKTCSINCLI